jgi:hypothetical protein
MAGNLVGASVWEAALHDHLTSHEESERGLLEEYRAAAEGSQSAAFRYLVGLIVEDEIRHHRVFRELAEALQSDVNLRSEEPVVPRLDRWGPDAAEVLRLTETLLEREHADARELARLGDHLEDLEGTSLWPLLVELMEMDTEKHIKVLRFVQRNAALSAD